MFTQTYNIGAYMPAVSDEQSAQVSGQLSIADGENFAWKAAGVHSAHGHYRRHSAMPNTMRHPGDFTIQSIEYFFLSSGVYTEAADGSLQQVFAYAANIAHPEYDLGEYKWTYGYVGTRHWFCHPQVGLIYYDQFDDEWGFYRDDCWSGPTYAVTQADNRLVVLLEDTVVWSKFDRGDEYACGWECGAGAQSLALIRYGRPYTVMPYNNSWLTFTSMGVMLSAPNNQQTLDPDGRNILVGALVFHHEELTFDELLIGPCAVCHVDEREVLWMTTKGLRKFAPAQGGGFGSVATFEPAMSRFYKENILPQIADYPQDYICIDYARDCGWLFVSSKDDSELPYYTRAHVYQFEIERWGSFDFEHLHIGYGRDYDRKDVNALPHYGFIDSTSAACVVTHSPHEHAWIRFAPHRFVAPEENVAATMLSSVEQIRLGVSKPGWAHKLPNHKRSSWADDKRAQQEVTKAAMLVQGGFDSQSVNGDEMVYAQITHRTESAAVYALHATGIAHSITIETTKPNEFFDVSSLEVSFFYAGVL